MSGEAPILIEYVNMGRAIAGAHHYSNLKKILVGELNSANIPVRSNAILIAKLLFFFVNYIRHLNSNDNPFLRSENQE